jgi:hypothetical protein
LREEQLLLITGLHYRDEGYKDGESDLGQLRAEAIAELFGNHLPAERMMTRSEIANITTDLRQTGFPGYELSFLTRNENIIELPFCTLLYFPSDSLSPRNDTILNTYYDDLARHLLETGESVKLRTLVEHSPEFTEDRLTSWRFAALKKEMTVAGIPAEKIVLMDSTDHIPLALPERPDIKIEDWIALIFIK